MAIAIQDPRGRLGRAGEGSMRGRGVRATRGLWALLLLVCGVSLAAGAPGDLDATFGSGGVVVTDLGGSESPSAVILQPDGKLVVAGTFFQDAGTAEVLLARYLPDGQLDGSFGSGGTVITAFTWAFGNALVLQPDGKLVVAGSDRDELNPHAYNNVLLTRFLPDGTLDASFGTGGSVRTGFGTDSGGSASAQAVVLQPDGRLVVAGSIFYAPYANDTILARYQPDGQLDASFGTGGKLLLDFGASDGATAMLLQPDGKLVVAGSAGAGRFSLPHVLIARFLPDGRLDATFGTGGVVRTALGGGASATAVVRQSDGKLVVAGNGRAAEEEASTEDLMLVRYQPDGGLDPTFGTGGIVLTDFGATEYAAALVQSPDGRLILGGTSASYGDAGETRNVVLARYGPEGALDVTFGTEGKVATDLGEFDGAAALVLQPDGKLVVAGFTGAMGLLDLALLRYQTAGCADHDRACRRALAQFVTGFYVQALERVPRPAEVAGWVASLEADPTVATTSAMVHAFFDGPEYRARPVTLWDHVTALYEAILGRAPEPDGLAWWVGVVLDRLNMAVPVFLEAPEFQRLVPDCREASAVTALVTRLYEAGLGRTPSPDEVMTWTDYILATCDLEGAVEAFFTAEEYLSVPRTLADHVTILYRALLAREPAVEEAMFWVDDLAGQLALIEEGFIQSAEFQARWQQLFL